MATKKEQLERLGAVPLFEGLSKAGERDLCVASRIDQELGFSVFRHAVGEAVLDDGVVLLVE